VLEWTIPGDRGNPFKLEGAWASRYNSTSLYHDEMEADNPAVQTASSRVADQSVSSSLIPAVHPWRSSRQRSLTEGLWPSENLGLATCIS
jgi:hypothetical protein